MSWCTHLVNIRTAVSKEMTQSVTVAVGWVPFAEARDTIACVTSSRTGSCIVHGIEATNGSQVYNFLCVCVCVDEFAILCLAWVRGYSLSCSI